MTSYTNPAKAPDISTWSVMKSKCATCPFQENGSHRVRASVESRVMEASQICHHPRTKGKKETHLCRGGRDHQLTIFYRMGLITAPTDAAWTAKRKELGL